ncbi:class IV adenylate cyclase [Staphylothermus hellenicus]|uniref:Adenylyl cyclase CyaB n=1 Tax=Staphylothermus hellenicus (strain DSM 12710 / JCM 10830 / BK20S6-10-b1 / P8) TaxID=591019 RepID=D7D9C4_STAHD|nr:class IV adenylate cyclase [Staphylothermus hellenicus]ADI32370.1 adenylyl cyclase CyaB [Staphylothermus hellenicus DSM 12710]
MNNYVEVEGKYRITCNNIRKINYFLEENGFKEKYRVVEKDIYYNHPCRDFSRTDEALRVRIRKYIGQGIVKIVLTYKGSRKILAEGVKARKEIEVELNNWRKMDKILLSLGFQRVASFVKERIIYRKKDVEVTIDHVYGLGRFMEVETNNRSIIENIYSSLSECLQPVNKTYLELCLETQKCRDDFDDS